MSRTGNQGSSTSAVTTGSGQVTSLDQARKQAANRGKGRGLTEAERQLLLEEIAKVTAELGDLQARAADITRRVSSPPRGNAERTA